MPDPDYEIAGQNKSRSDWMREAYWKHGYTMQAIADYVALHYSTASRLIKEGDENARN